MYAGHSADKGEVGILPVEDHSRFRTRSERVVVKDAGPEVVVYDLDTDRVHLLNPLASSIWRLSKNEVTAAQVWADLVLVPALEDVSEEMVQAAIAELDDAGLLVGSPPTGGRRISRRAVLKAAGIAGLAAPVLTTILAPTPAAAVSPCLGTGAACTGGAQCCSNVCTDGQCSGCLAFGSQGCGGTTTCCSNTCTTLSTGRNFCCTPAGASCTAGATDVCCTVGDGRCPDTAQCPACIATGSGVCTLDRQCCSGSCVAGTCAA